MAKPNEKVMTPGVQRLGIDPPLLQLMFRKAEAFYPRHDFLVFALRDGRIEVSDGNGRRLGEIQRTLPGKVWIKTDDYGSKTVSTALLPSEY